MSPLPSSSVKKMAFASHYLFDEDKAHHDGNGTIGTGVTVCPEDSLWLILLVAILRIGLGL
jgi:hypothetical protein